MRLLTFSNDCEHTNSIFKALKIIKLEDITQFDIFKLICISHDKQIPMKEVNCFTLGESVNPYNTRGSKLTMTKREKIWTSSLAVSTSLYIYLFMVSLATLESVYK